MHDLLGLGCLSELGEVFLGAERLCSSLDVGAGKGERLIVATVSFIRVLAGCSGGPCSAESSPKALLVLLRHLYNMQSKTTFLLCASTIAMI